MTPTPSATSTDATTATEPVVCPNCGSLLYQQSRAGESSMMCAGCHTTLSFDGQQLENISLSRVYVQKPTIKFLTSNRISVSLGTISISGSLHWSYEEEVC